MSLELTASYPTLRRTRAVLRMTAPLISGVLSLVGLSLFVGLSSKLTNPGFALSERMIFGVIGLGYLLGLPLAGFVMLYVLRAGADLIDVWIDTAVSAEKTANLIERQLVPGIQRLCQILEKSHDSAGSASPRPASGVAAETRARPSGPAQR